LRKEPGKRYASAGALAEDLRCFLAAKPIQARPIRAWERVVKWARRRPAAAALVAVSILASMLLVSGLVVGIVVVADKQRETEDALRREKEVREEIEQTSYLNGVTSAFHEVSLRNWGRADEYLEGCPEKLRGWEWRYLKRLRHTPAIDPLPVGERVNMVSGFDLAFDPSSRLLAVPSNDHSIRVWDASSGRKVLTLNGHTDRVLSLAFSPDGRRLASTSEDKTVKVWDLMAGLENGELRKPLFTCPHEERVIGVAFSFDGQRLASASGETDKPGQVKVWDAASGKLLFKPFPGQARPDPLVHLAFSPDGRRLASGSVDNSVKVWDLTTGDEVYTLSGHTDSVINVTFTPDGRRLISASRGREVKLWDLPAGEPGVATPEGRVLAPRWTLPDFSNSVWAMALSADGSHLAIGGDTADGNVRIYDRASGKLLHTLRGDIRIISVAFSPDGRRLAAAGHERVVRLWDTTTGQEVLSLRGHKDIIGRVLFSQDGQRLASASADGEVRIWDASPFDKDADPRIRTLPPHPTLSPRSGGEGWVKGDDGEFFGLAFCPTDSRLLASASADKSIKLWDIQTGQVVRTFHGHKEAAICVAFSPDGRRLLSGSMDRTVKLWDAQTGKELLSIPGFKVMVHSLAFSPTGPAFATGSHRKLQLWDSQTGHLLLERQADPEFVGRVAFSPDGKYLATAGHGGTAKVWNVTSGKEICSFTKHQTSVLGVAFHPQGEYLASGGFDHRVRLWDPVTADEITTLSGHTHSVNSVAFSPDGRYLASASGKEVIVWDVTDLENIKSRKIFDRLPGRTGRCVAFSPDGKRLAVASGYKGKGVIKIWDTSLWDNQASGRRKPPEGRDR
jgi:WD40 repeat protein